MKHPSEEEADPALTDELRAVMRPRTRGLMLALVLLVLVLGGLSLVASRTVLAQLWR